MTAAAVVLSLALAALSPVLGAGWLGHGLYKMVLLGFPFAGGRGPAWRSSVASAAVPALLLGTALGGLGLGIAAATAGLAWDPAAFRSALEARFHYTPVALAAAALAIATVNALLEEWFYRAWLDERVGMAASGGVFAVQHVLVLAPLAGMPAAFAAGAAVLPAALAWSLLARRHGWGAAVISHVAADLVLFAGGLHLMGFGS